MAVKPKTIDDYLDGVTAAQRVVLERLRKSIRAAVPEAEECIHYGVAAFRLKGNRSPASAREPTTARTTR